MNFYKIKWTNKAISQLEKIADYYFEYSPTASQSIVSAIFRKVALLEIYPSSYPIEQLLVKLNKQHRFMICGNYKIIFRIVEQDVFIHVVFDCRQNPKKIKKLIR